jgi:hypothetical protein
MHFADSCQDVLIENCYISVGDDAIAIKSGWDQYGIAYGQPSSNILIRNVTVRSLVRYTLLCQQYVCALVFYCKSAAQDRAVEYKVLHQDELSHSFV